jgi:hypothetical protein
VRPNRIGTLTQGVDAGYAHVPKPRDGSAWHKAIRRATDGKLVAYCRADFLLSESTLQTEPPVYVCTNCINYAAYASGKLFEQNVRKQKGRKSKAFRQYLGDTDE